MPSLPPPTPARAIGKATVKTPIPDTYDADFELASKRYGVPAALLKVVGWRESTGYRLAQPIKDGKPLSSAIGVMQTINAVVVDYNKATKSSFVHPTLAQLKGGFDVKATT